MSLVPALAAVSVAQEVKPVGFSLKFGQFVPQNNRAEQEGKKWTLIGIDTKIKDIKYGAKGNGRYLTLSADYYGKGDFSSIPVMVNYVTRSNEWYYLFGVGAAYVTDVFEIGPDRFEEESFEVAFTAGIGYDFQQWKMPLFGEVRFMGNGNNRLNGYVISVGIRL